MLSYALTKNPVTSFSDFVNIFVPAFVKLATWVLAEIALLKYFVKELLRPHRDITCPSKVANRSCIRDDKDGSFF
jgi:hypothetical protein